MRRVSIASHHPSIELEHFSGNMRLSRNGKWLGLSAWDYVVLSAETGETRFRFRTVDNVRREFERIRSVLPANASVSDIGTMQGAFFFEDYLIFGRRIGSLTGCSLKQGQTYDPTRYRECIREHRIRGKYRVFRGELKIPWIDRRFWCFSVRNP